MSDVHVHRFGPDYLCVCGATPMDDLERENQALRKALEQIVETRAEVEFRGNCAYCQSKSIAREALGSRRGVRRGMSDEHAHTFDGPSLRCATCGVHALDVITTVYYEARAERDQARRERDELQGRIDETLKALNERSPFFGELRRLLAGTTDDDANDWVDW